MSAATNSPDQTADLARRLANMIRIGTIAELDHDQALCRVQTGELLTDWLNWLALRAGETSHWSAPSIGEQVLLLSPSGDPAQGLVLPAVYGPTDPPSHSASAHVTRYPDGATISYDHASGALSVSGVRSATVQASSSCTIDCPETVVTGNLTVQGRLTYQGGLAGSGGSGATMTGPLVQTSGPLSSNGVVLDSHTHPGDSGGQTGAPN